jgi:Flp pilus assembly pilin Flp
MLKKFWKDESGQNTTEYILMLAVLFMVFNMFKKKLMEIIKGLLTGIDQKAQNAMQDDSSSE